METDKQKYGEYVKEITPVHNLPKSIVCTFLVGDVIRVIGQFITSFLMNRMEMEQGPTAMWNLLALIFLSIVLTGLSIYPKIVEFSGASALIPIIGLTNSVVASVIEFHAEGEVFGVDCKIFIIAGPMTLYGIPASRVSGPIHWVGKQIGIFRSQQQI